MTLSVDRDGFMISTDKTRLNVELIHQFLCQESYWAQGRSLETVLKSIEHSESFGVYEGERQIGFARVVTDYCTFAWLADVFIVPEYRGRGLSKWLVSVIVAHPGLQGLTRWLLATKDAHGLYCKFGFADLPEGRFLMRVAG